MKFAALSLFLLGVMFETGGFDSLGLSTLKAVRGQTAQGDPENGAGRATKVRLRGPSTVADALSSVGAQAGARFRGAENHTSSVALDDREYGFWEAVDHILAAADLHLMPYAGDDGVFHVGPRPDPAATAPPPVYHGIFRVQPIRTEGARDLLQPAASQWRIIVGIWWEPRLRPIALQVPLSGVTVVGEPGSIDLSANPKDVVSESIATGAGGYTEVRVPLKVGEAALTSISRLDGELIVVIPGQTESFEFPDLDASSAGTEQRGQSVRIRLDGVGNASSENEIALRIMFEETHGALESHRIQWLKTIEIELNDGMGTAYQPRSRVSSVVSNSELSLRVLFPVKTESMRLVIRAPSGIHRISVPFSFRDMILP